MIKIKGGTISFLLGLLIYVALVRYAKYLLSQDLPMEIKYIEGKVFGKNLKYIFN